MNRRKLCALGAVIALLALTGCDKADARASREAVAGGSAAQALVADGYVAGQVLARDNQHYEFHRATTDCPTDGPCLAYLVYTDTAGTKVEIVATGGQYECHVPNPTSGKTNLQDYAKLSDELQKQVLQAPWTSQNYDNSDKPNVRVDGQLITCSQGAIVP